MCCPCPFHVASLLWEMEFSHEDMTDVKLFIVTCTCTAECSKQPFSSFYDWNWLDSLRDKIKAIQLQVWCSNWAFVVAFFFPGDVLSIASRVTFNSEKTLEVECLVDILRPFQGIEQRERSIEAYFTFVCIDSNKRPLPMVPLKVPYSSASLHCKMLLIYRPSLSQTSVLIEALLS